MRHLMLSLTTAGLVVLLAPTALAQNHTTVKTQLDDVACSLIRGDYGSPSATLHVVTECEGEDGWVVVLHEYANSTQVAFRYKDGPESEPMPFASFGPNGRPGEHIDWAYVDGRVFGAMLGYRDSPPPGQMNGSFNVYSIALKRDGDSPACLVARIEFGKKRGVDHAAELATHLFANEWKCGEDEMMEFAPEATDPVPLADMVREAARDAGRLPGNQE